MVSARRASCPRCSRGPGGGDARLRAVVVGSAADPGPEHGVAHHDTRGYVEQIADGLQVGDVAEAYEIAVHAHDHDVEAEQAEERAQAHDQQGAQQTGRATLPGAPYHPYRTGKPQGVEEQYL